MCTICTHAKFIFHNCNRDVSCFNNYLVIKSLRPDQSREFWFKCRHFYLEHVSQNICLTRSVPDRPLWPIIEFLMTPRRFVPTADYYVYLTPPCEPFLFVARHLLFVTLARAPRILAVLRGVRGKRNGIGWTIKRVNNLTYQSFIPDVITNDLEYRLRLLYI